MLAIKKALKSIAPIRHMVIKRRLQAGSVSQSDEGKILKRLSDQTGAPKTFIEFGFHVAEFNCSFLCSDHQGLLIDGSRDEVEDGRKFLPPGIRCEQRFLTLDNLDMIRGAFEDIGILSIDVDGNDYWFLEALIDLSPTIICIEYNASFGFHSLSVPYDPNFDRAAKHASGWYHGASLTALAKLAASKGYGLAGIASGGGNAFFTKAGCLDPVAAWKPTALRDQWSKTTAEQQWETIKKMPYVEIL